MTQSFQYEAYIATIKLTSSDVPLSKRRSASFHMVGTGIYGGKNLIYSLHGVATHRCPWPDFCLLEIRCEKRYSKILYLAFF